ncbi:MAG: S8 family serine peptidase [Blastocatellales bacterium]|nr:S8 family serine peptidase [Blastocatellales bacterium]
MRQPRTSSGNSPRAGIVVRSGLSGAAAPGCFLAILMLLGALDLRPSVGAAGGRSESAGAKYMAPAQSQSVESEISNRRLMGNQSIDDLARKAGAEGAVRVIVVLRGDFETEGRLSAAAALAQRSEIARTATALLNRLPAGSFGSLKAFEIFPLLAFEINAEGLEQLRNAPEVAAMQEDALFHATLAESTEVIGAPAAWAAGYEGNNQAVAILDTGVSKTHPFLEGKVVAEACYSTNGSQTSSVCPGGVSQSTETGSGVNCAVAGCEHGTHVAGTAAGKSTSFSGVARNASIIAIQVFSRINGCTSSTDCTVTFNSDILLGMQRVQQLSAGRNIAAVNLSLGGGGFGSNCDASQPAFKTAIDSLRSLGIATVVASGNSGSNGGLSSPACISTAISVGSSADGSNGSTLNTVSGFSNSASFLHLLAPGEWINSSVPGGGFSNFRGTSMAAPHVAGAWAVMKSKLPGASVAQILQTLQNTGLPINDSRNGVSKPRIRLDAAVNMLAGNVCNYAITPTTQAIVQGGGSGVVNITADGGCLWEARSNVPWLSITSGGSGSGNGAVGYSAAANTGLDRSGTLFIAGHTLVVTQPGIPVLSVDDGSFENASGLAFGGSSYRVNRLTPASYPATINAVAIYFSSDTGVRVGDSLTVIAGINPSGSSNINGVTFRSTPVTVQALDQFNVYMIPGLATESGDFIVGMLLSHSPGVLPFVIDETPPSRGRSYRSTDGVSFAIIDSIGLPGNYGIRAVPTQTFSCPTVSGINPAIAPAGSTVTITGTGFSGVTSVKFSNNLAAQFAVNGNTSISFTAPDGAPDGPITISKPNCADVQTGTFALARAIATAAGSSVAAENCPLPNGAVEPGERVTVNFSLRNTGNINTTSLTATLQATGGVNSPSGPQNYGVLTAGGAAAARPFTFTASGTCGGMLTATLSLQDGATSLGAVTYNIVLGSERLIFSEDFDSVTAPALPDGWVSTGSPAWVTSTTLSDSAPNNAFVMNSSTITDISLDSPGIAVTSATAQLTFRHRYDTEACCDGGNLEIAIGGGGFTDIIAAGGSFVAGGYNGTRWGGSSGGYITTTVNLPVAAAGMSIRLRWRMRTDFSIGGAGWRIDGIRLTEGYECATGCNGPLCAVIGLTPSLPVGGLNTSYNQTVTGSGGAAPYTFTVSAGALPAGLTLSPNGVLSGVPLQGGSYNFTIRATDANGCMGARSYTLVIVIPVVAAAGSSVAAENCPLPNGAVEPGERVTVNFSLRNTGNINTTSLTATLQATGGVNSPSGPQNYGVLTAGGAAAARPFTFTASGTCGGMLTATLSLQDGATSLGTVTYNIVLGSERVIFSEDFDSVTAPALPDGWVSTGSPAWVTSTTLSDSAPNNAFVMNSSTITDISLDSPGIAVTSAAAQVTFRHRYDTESCCDGGNLEIAVGGGGFTDIIAAGGSFVAGGYNGTRWGGSSGGYITTTVNLPAAAAGMSIRLRWRMRTDFSIGGAGWRIDGIRLTEGYECATGCNGPLCAVIGLTPSLPVGGLNTSYNQMVTGSGGAAPYTFTVSAGALPAGLTLSPNGVLSGVPLQGGSYNFTIRATDANGCVGTRSYDLVIMCPPISLSPSVLPNSLTGIAYNQILTAGGGTAPYSFAVTAGNLPGGLTLASTGQLSGVPNTTGSFNFTVTATSGNGCQGTRSYTIIISRVLGAQDRPLYVLNDSTSGNRIYGYTVNEMTGALAPLDGFPISTGGNGEDLVPCEMLTIDEANLRLYAINVGSGTLSAYSINPATGVLTALPFSPIMLGSGGWTTVVVHPSGSPLVVGDGGNPGRLASYLITQTTATAAPGSPYTTGSARPFSSIFSRDGNYLYTGGNSGTTFAGFSVNATTGMLTALTGSPFNSDASFPAAYAMDAQGRLYLGNDLQVRVFTTPNGIPTAVSGNPFSSGVATTFDGLLHPGGYYAVSDAVGNRVAVYRINGSGSGTTLSAVSGSPFSTSGSAPLPLALNQAGTFLYAANGNTRNLTTFSFDAATGALNRLNTQPVETLGATGRLTGMAYLPGPSAPCSTITVSPVSLPDAGLGVPYNQSVAASPAGSYTFIVTAGALPAGLSLDSATGAITGAPTTTGTVSFTLTAQSNAGCIGSRAYTLNVGQATNPVPVLISLDPAIRVAGSAGFTMSLQGSGFIPTSRVSWNGAERPVNFVNNTRLTINVAASDVAASGTAGIAVTNPGPGGGASSVLVFTIANPATTVSAASFQAGPLTPNSIVAAFGSGLAVGQQSAVTSPLPFLILGTFIQVRDSAGISRQAQMFFVSPGQVNYIIPEGTSAGEAMVAITSGDGRVSFGTIQIAPVALGLFTANSSGMGVASANALRVTAGGAQIFEDVAQFDPGANRFIPKCISLGPSSESVFLILYGTGVRGIGSLSSITATIGGVGIPVSFAGAHSQFVGLDQINLGPVPRELIGRGVVNIVISVNGQPANTVQVCIE